MFVLRKSVRRCKNIYIASLAAADLAIGLTLPVAALEQVESRWVLQGVPCRVYQTVRCSLLYVSLLSVLLITADRWWSIHYPFSYRVRQSKRLAGLAVLVVWFVAFALHVPPVLFWDYVIGRSDVTNDVSETERADDTSEISPPPGVLSSTMKQVVVSSEASSAGKAPEEESFDSEGVEVTWEVTQTQMMRMSPADRNRCELPYDLNYTFVLTVSVVLYILPLVALWVLNCSLYFKITRRKSIKIRRSLSVNDNYLLTFRKSSSESESSPNYGADGSETGDIRAAEQRQRLLAVTRAGRRHTFAFPMHQSKLGGNGGGGAGCGRFTSSGNSGVGGGSLVPMGLWYGSGQRHSVCSTRKQSDDLVRELLVRQDKKAARLLGLLVTVFTLCWLPHTLLALLRAYHPLAVPGWSRDLVFWVLVTNSAINPFLYGLLNAEFRKILRGWFYFTRSSKFRLKHALLYWSLPPNGDSDGVKEAAPVAAPGLFATPIKE
ncbi:hypothetical protein ACOMHN_046917 [Nucella lapillus]